MGNKKTKKKKIAIYIPTYNAGQTLPIVIDRIPAEIKQEVKEIFVIDNASRDNTYFTAIGYKQHHGCLLYTSPSPRD